MKLALRGILAIWLAISVYAAGIGHAEVPPSAPKIYTHPTLGYSVAIPGDAKVRIPKDGGNVDIAIDSGKGFGVILQSAPAGPETSISELAAMLEAAYLGPDKAWRQKVGQEVSLVSGLVSFNGYYEGGEASYRVVITRGQANTYTFVFRARTSAFSDLSPDFDTILEGFRPAPDDLPPEAPAAVAEAEAATETETPSAPEPVLAAPPEVQSKKEKTLPEPSPVATAPAPKPDVAVAPVPAPPTVHSFDERRLGYSLEYDLDWVMERPSENSVMFSGPEGTDAFFATVSIQNVAPPSAESAVQSASLVMDEIRNQFKKDAQGATFEREGPYVFRKEDIFLLGREFMVDYVLNNERFRQWTIIVPRPEGRVTYIWSYRAPRGDFRRFLPMAERILSSWKIFKKANNESAAS